jgi:hypothetical protein
MLPLLYSVGVRCTSPVTHLEAIAHGDALSPRADRSNECCSRRRVGRGMGTEKKSIHLLRVFKFGPIFYKKIKWFLKNCDIKNKSELKNVKDYQHINLQHCCIEHFSEAGLVFLSLLYYSFE